MPTEATAKIEPALLTIPQICEILNVSRAEFYRLNSNGKFAPLPVNLCRKVLYSRIEVESWLAAKCPHRQRWLTMQRERFANE
jgi:predicted DNA-binding transcriptional regulator AlpA